MIYSRKLSLSFFQISTICLFILCIPTNVAYAQLSNILVDLCYIVFLWACFIFYKKKIYKIKWYFPLFTLLAWMILSTMISNPIHTERCVKTVINLFSITVITEHLMKQNNKKTIRYLCIIWSCLLTIQAISFITGCFGYTSTPNTPFIRNYLFGIRVNIDQYIIYGLFFCALSALQGEHWQKILYALGIASGVYFVLGEAVSTSMLGLFVFLFVNIASKIIRSKNVWRNLVIFSLGFIAVFVLSQSTSFFRYIFVDILQKDITLSGRTVLWVQALEQIKGIKALTGFGYAPASNLYVKEGFAVNHPHNQYLQVLYENGYPGLILYLIIIWKQISLIRKINDFKIRSIYIACLLANLTMSIASRNFMYLTAQIFYVISFHIGSMEIQKRHMLTEE